MCISSFDFNNDGVPELVTGWSSGKVDIKNQETGEILYKTMFGSHIAGIVKVLMKIILCLPTVPSARDGSCIKGGLAHPLLPSVHSYTSLVFTALGHFIIVLTATHH